MVVYVKVNLDIGATGNSASAPRQIRMTDIEKKRGMFIPYPGDR